MDQASVSAHFHLAPGAPGLVSWPRSDQLVFSHDPLRAATRYQAILDAGYRDAAGNVNGLRHAWQFTTEQPPSLGSASPGAGERDVDPATYITLSFSRPMDARTLASAVNLSPGGRVDVRTDPADGRRVILAPADLLSPGLDYTVTVTSQARDVDGNPLGSGFAYTFTTGVERPLHHWLGFATDSQADGAGQGVWIVDENRFPRRVSSAAVDTFAWSPDSSHLLLRRADGSWADASLGGMPQSLPIHASWAAFLTGDRGYAYLDRGSLRVLQPDGGSLDLATDVSGAAVGPRGLRIAYVTGSEIWGYDLDLHSRYRIQVESGDVSGLAWAPDGSYLAYRLAAPESGRAQIRVRALTGPGAVTTVASGELGDPAWQADSRHLILAGTLATPSGPIGKAFRVSVADLNRPLDLAAGLPAGPLNVQNPLPSPDGHQIAFLAELQGHTEVFLMNADGTGLDQLTAYDPAAFPYSCRAPAWTSS